ncbi:aminoglycoside phosphotransferase family protein [Candidatus Kaiserbacteria bacterium]|nr:aminoglycoside phosphotransferase family protein [Candidatus Kaiserbacteria bacterium]USN92606.1 MAG: aminoglycoside phosphotransferase family protein [Candidatus Nomurabacteria bacterium]
MQSNEKLGSDEHHKPNVIFRNEPKLSEHEIDNDLNKMRTEFMTYIQDFVTEHDLFKNETEVGIEFAQKGVSSVIAIIDTPAGKWVLKIPRNKRHTVGEGEFFQVWEKAGVTVPQVIETGELNDSPYTLMEYIDAQTLDTCYSHEELLAKGTFVEMGEALRCMHSESADGYGFVVDGKPEFETVEEWLEGDDMKRRFDYIDEHNLLEGIEDELDKALEVIKQHSENSDSTYCHDDFGTANIFATDPITIFDPQPKFNSGYYDLGKINFIKIAMSGSDESFKQLLDGYFDDNDCNDAVLNAYTFLAFCMKCPYWHRTGRQEQLETAKKYFRNC